MKFVLSARNEWRKLDDEKYTYRRSEYGRIGKNVSILCASNCRVTTRVNVLCTGDSRRKIVGIIERQRCRPAVVEKTMPVDLIVVEITENVHNGNRWLRA